jgi:DNA-binding IclR family transcriptional regulator
MHEERGSSNATVGATETSFAIVKQLERTGGAGVTELAATLDRSKSTVHKHLATLRDLGYVTKVGDTYTLGLRFLGLGDRARDRTGMYEVAKAETDDLVESVGERVQVMVEEEGRGIYIYQAKTEQAIRTDSHIGTTVTLHATAVGKSYLAFLPTEKRDALLDDLELDSRTENTLTDRTELVEELDAVRDRGYAFNDEERIAGMHAVGAPILSDDDRVLGAISVSGPTTRLSGSWYREEVPELVQQSARIIGLKATYS